MNVYIGGAKDYSALQGPAPGGFHIPLITEWQGLKTIMDGLGLTTGNNWRINLHMPFTGYRHYSYAGVNSQGSNGHYWSSSPYGSDRPQYARKLYLGSSNVLLDNDVRANGYSIRCFKNSYVEPTASWTVIQGTLGSAGIFRDTVNGLISITSDGITGYTIADKNLGATTVYNNGDTLSEANCGKYYQWGNNYGFAWTGSVTTSSTQVDASTYGPGNYYSGSTFITRSSTPYDWSSVQNDNLRGGVTGIVSPAPLKNAYIGEVIECDFTQSDYGFTFVTTAGPGTITYGRDSNGLYTKSTGAQGGTSWHIPSSIYSIGNIKKAVFEFSGGATKNGGGFGTEFDTKRMRHYTGLRVIWGSQNQSGTGEDSPASIWTFTADLENKLLSSSISNNTMALTDNAISAFNTDWDAGNVNIHTLAYTANTYAYIRKITFYFA